MDLFTGYVPSRQIQVSMDGKGRATDNVFLRCDSFTIEPQLNLLWEVVDRCKSLNCVFVLVEFQPPRYRDESITHASENDHQGCASMG